MAEVVVVLLLALLGLFGSHEAHPAACPPASGLSNPVCGDVDGKPGKETVGIDTRPGKVLLSVRFADHTVVTPLHTDLWTTKPSEEQGGAQTFVNGLAALDRGPGLTIVVTAHRGASTAFGQLFKVENGSLRKIPIPAAADGEFAYEGSVTHFSVIDCVTKRSGLIWISGYGWDGHYTQERTLYRLNDDELVHVRDERSRPTVNEAGRLREFAEPQPFPHCLVVRNSRTH